LSFEIVGAGERAPEASAGFDAALPSIAKVDLAALQAREEQTIREMKKKDAQKGKGVSREAQELFDFISRTYVSPLPSPFPLPLHSLPSLLLFTRPTVPQC
jgi:hypothetical protein